MVLTWLPHSWHVIKAIAGPLARLGRHHAAGLLNAIIDDYIEHVEEKQTREAKDVPNYSGLKRASGKSKG